MSRFLLRARPPAPLRGVLFDMDGTLTRPGAIDFAAMRARVGAPAGVDVLAHVASFSSAAERDALLGIIVEEEERGLQRMELADHAREVLDFLAERRVPRGLITRNNDAAMRRTVALLGRDDAFDVMLSRSFTPTKPRPEPLLHIVEKWRLEPARVAMVGDAIDDVQCARAAGAFAILIGPDAQCRFFKEALPLADAAVASLAELRELLAFLLDDDATAPVR